MLMRNIWAVGRNYADHAKELGNAVPASPLIFLKAGSTASFAAQTLRLHPGAIEVHHELEIGLRFGPDLEIDAACLALDLTDRPRQNELKSRGEPWTLAKSFKDSCPLSKFFAISSLQELSGLEIKLWVNDELRQSATTSQMIFSPRTLVDFVLKEFPVCPGDLLLTGTPAGVGRLKSGDRLIAELSGKLRHAWRVE